MRKLGLMALLFLVGCQTAARRNQALLEDRVQKLSHLSRTSSTVCRMDVELSEPAAARYREMFPKEKSLPSYRWRFSEVRCEISPETSSPLADAQKALLDTAACLLLQVYWHNSPFDDLELKRLEGHEERVQLITSDDPSLGIFLERDRVAMETRTRRLGQLNAEYAEIGGRWLPARLEQRIEGATVAVEEFDFESNMSGRPHLKAFTLAVGNEQAFRHSRVSVNECRPD